MGDDKTIPARVSNSRHALDRDTTLCLLGDSQHEIPQTFLSETSKHGKNETQPACKHVVSAGSSHTGHAEVAGQETELVPR